MFKRWRGVWPWVGLVGLAVVIAGVVRFLLGAGDRESAGALVQTLVAVAVPVGGVAVWLWRQRGQSGTRAPRSSGHAPDGLARSAVRQDIDATRDAYTAVNQTVNHYPAPVAESAGRPELLPRDVPGFTGRTKHLEELRALAGRGGAVVVTAIDGTAGVGKTALAVHAAHQLLGGFPDGHLYADLRGHTSGQVPVAPGLVLETFLRYLGVAGEEVPAGVEDRSALLRQRLAGRRVLMVLDNAATEAQVRPLLPGAGASLVIVTSRIRLTGLEVDTRLTLDVLPEPEAVDLLAGIIGVRADGEREALGEAARLCGCLPLALRIAGQILAAHPAWPMERLVELLAGEQNRLNALVAGDLEVRAAFEVSYRYLDAQTARVFARLGLHLGPDLDTSAAAALSGLDEKATGVALERLGQAHLVEEEVAGRYRMHDLLRLFARATVHTSEDEQTRDEAISRLLEHYLGLARVLNACLDPRQSGALAAYLTSSGNQLPEPRRVVARFETERRNFLAVLRLAADRGLHPTVWGLAEATSATLHLLRRFDEAITCYQQALTICRETGDRHGEG